jgi:hypothetical protein
MLGNNEMLSFQRSEEVVYRRCDIVARHLEFLLEAGKDLVAVYALLEKRPDARAGGVQLEDPIALEMHEDGGTAHVARDDSRTRSKIRGETGTLLLIRQWTLGNELTGARQIQSSPGRSFLLRTIQPVTPWVHDPDFSFVSLAVC